MLNGEYHPEEGWNDGLWVRENVSAVRHLQHGLHLPVPALKFLSCRDSRVKEEGLPVAPGEDPAAGDPRRQGFTVTGTGEGLPEAPPGHPRGCDHSL